MLGYNGKEGKERENYFQKTKYPFSGVIFLTSSTNENSTAKNNKEDEEPANRKPQYSLKEGKKEKRKGERMDL